MYTCSPEEVQKRADERGEILRIVAVKLLRKEARCIHIDPVARRQGFGEPEFLRDEVRRARVDSGLERVDLRFDRKTSFSTESPHFAEK